MVNEYILLRSIGKGSYAKVKLAMSAITEQAYAIKIMHKQSLIRKLGHEGGLGTVEREIAILKKIHHPNVVRLYEVIDDPDNDRLFLVLEYVANGAVKELSSDGTCEPIPESTAREYFRQTVQGLEYLHSLRILHRDIKPENLLLDDEDNVKLTDFGVSLLYEGEDDSLTASAGTPAFLSPEACSGDSATNYSGKAADIWALGVTLYVFIFGKLPFQAKPERGFTDLYDSIIQDELEFPDEVDSDLFDLLRQILDKNPKTRITLNGIKSHPWTTDHGARPMANNKAKEQVKISDEEVGNAINRFSNIDRFALLVKMKSRLSKKADEARERLAVQNTFSSAASEADDYELPSEIRSKRRRKRSASAFSSKG